MSSIKTVFIISSYLFILCVSGSTWTVRDNESTQNEDVKTLIKAIKILLKNVNDVTPVDSEENADDDVIEGRQFLRHHIAHFCPNLDEARTCIRACMKVGKPAFCGKDHVCYCGHRYSHHDKDPPVDPNDVYAQFQDLYTKYFGPNSR